MRKIGVGVIGCGVISKAYMNAMKRFPQIELKAVSDMQQAPAEGRAAEFGVPALRTDDLLRRDDIEIVVNLTVPLAHTDVSLAVLNAGKHVHSEKPIGVNMVEARKVMDLAEKKGLRVGCAPDTFLGGGHQTARKLLDDGAIGQPVGGSAFFMCPGHERWHPHRLLLFAGRRADARHGSLLHHRPDPAPGTDPQRHGAATRLRSERIVTSQPMNGAKIPVEVATHVTGVLGSSPAPPSRSR